MFVIGCSKDDSADDPNLNIPVKDPEGTVPIQVFNESYGYGYTGVYPDGCDGYFFISYSNNFYGGTGTWSFARIGEVSGLGNITTIPNSGFAREVSVEPGYGYVAKNEKNSDITYVRIYVEDWIISTSGGIMGAEIKYQSPFEPTSLTFSKDTLSFTKEKGTQTVTITTAASGWTYSCNTSWINIVKNNNTLSVSVQANDYSERQGTIVIQANEKRKNIIVEQGTGQTPSSKSYAVGNLYNENGINGVVYKVSSDGHHGMIVHLQETKQAWSTANEVTNCTNSSNGMINMNTIKQIVNWENKYPAFKWCDNFNMGGISGWYLPALDELNELNMNLTAVNAALSQYGGAQITPDWYCSSTEYSNSEVWYEYFGSSQSTYSKGYTGFKVRAVCAF